IAQSHVRVPSRSHVTHTGKSRHKGLAGILGAEDCLARNGVAKFCVSKSTFFGIRSEMYVDIDQSGKASTGSIDDAGNSGRESVIGLEGNDSTVLDQDSSVLDVGALTNIEQSCATK